MYLKFIAVILMLSPLTRTQTSPVLGSYRRKPADFCQEAIKGLDSQYSSVFLESTIVICEIQVVSGLNYRIFLTNNSFSSEDCYLYLYKRTSGAITIRESDNLDRNCMEQLKGSNISVTLQAIVENSPLEPQPLESAVTNAEAKLQQADVTATQSEAVADQSVPVPVVGDARHA